MTISKQLFVYGGSAGFILLSIYLVFQGMLPFLLLPICILIGLVAIYAIDKLLIFIVFCTPLSLNLEDMDLGGIGMYLPTEPLLLLAAILIFLAHLHKKIIPASILKHPLTTAILIYLLWIAFTALVSVRPVVSFKYLLARIWYIIPIYAAGAVLFSKEKFIRLFVWAYMLPLGMVALYSLYRLRSFGFTEEGTFWMMEPFFKDHTQLGAVLAIFIPVAIGQVMIEENGRLMRSMAAVLAILFLGCLVATFSRASWISLIFAAGVLLLMLLRVRWWQILGAGVVAIVLLVASYDTILTSLEENKTDSSEDLLENAESVTNISTDASNLERLNRWNSAIAMWKEKPFTGWGPGVYMFEYAPFQKSADMTVISTNFGDVGNAHSEFLGPLAEMGLPGLATVMGICLMGFLTFHRASKRNLTRSQRITLVSVGLGLTTYFAHGFLNNFLDTDKASVPVWGFLAILVAMELRWRKGMG